MTIHQPGLKDDINSEAPPEKIEGVEAEDAEGAPEDSDAPKPVNLQKRNYDLDAVRFGDWELNGRCIDF